MKKWLAEGTQEETKIVLGWMLNTRTFTLALPKLKVLSYTNQAKEILRLNIIHHKNPESIVGRLERTSYAVPNTKFFLNRIRGLLRNTKEYGCVRLPANIREDLTLHLKFIEKETLGMSINNLIFCSPSHFCWADSCPFRLGGYTVEGRVWRFYTLPSLRSENTNNVLEFMAQIITIWVDILENRMPQLSCIIACSNNASAVGWMYKSNFYKICHLVHEECAHKLVNLLMDANYTIYAQYQKGKHDTFADILSRWHFLSTVELTILFRSASNKFSDLSTSARDNLLDYICAAEVEKSNSVTDNTHKDRERVWR